MTARNRRRRRVVLASLLAAAGAALGGILGGSPLMRIAVAVVVLIATGVVVGRWPTRSTDGPPAYRSGRSAPPNRYPTYDEIIHKLSWAETSSTYTTRMLQPWLGELAHDLDITDIPRATAPIDVAVRLEQEIGDATR